MSKPLVSILILNWNGRSYLERCLASIQAQTCRQFEVVLVDNGSTDGSVELLRDEFADWLAAEELPHLRLVELVQNEGFSGGNIAGLAASNPASRYIATLNNDTWADPTWLENLMVELESQVGRWGAVAGPMLFANAPDIIASAGIEVRRDGLALDRSHGLALMDESEPSEIFGPCAGAALYRRETLTEVGFFDPAFFAYLEDADLAWRLRLAGWRSLYVPRAKVWHEYSGTGGQNSPFKNFQLGRNRLWVILKNWPTGLLWRHGWRIVAYDLAASAYTLLVKRQPDSLRGRLVALRPRHLKRLWRQRRGIQAGRIATLAELERWLMPSLGPADTLRSRQITDDLAAGSPTTTIP